MGRYDKIRVWNGSSWVQPSRMYVWNGSSWVDFGTNDSDNTRTLYIWDGSSWVRKTLNRKSNTVTQEKYLQYNGGAATSLPDGYQFYGSKYEFIVQPDAQGNYMMFETGSSNSACYARFGFYNNGSKYYVYGKSRYNNGTAYEANTTGSGTLAAGVKYKITFRSQNADAVQVYNYSTGSTWKAKMSTLSRFYSWGCSASMFNGCLTTDRNLYGKVWYAYVRGCKNSTTTNYAEYDVDSSSAGSSTLVVTSQSSAGGVAGGNRTHHGTIIDPSYVYYTWE